MPQLPDRFRVCDTWRTLVRTKTGEYEIRYHSLDSSCCPKTGIYQDCSTCSMYDNDKGCTNAPQRIDEAKARNIYEQAQVENSLAKS